MKLTDKFPNAHPDAVRCFDDMMTAARGYDVFFAAIVAHQVMVQALYYIAQDYPNWKKEFAEQLRVTADWCEFMPADSMCKAMSDNEYQALIDKHRFDAT